VGLSNALTDTGICTSIKYLPISISSFIHHTRWVLFNFFLPCDLCLARYIIYAMALCLCVCLCVCLCMSQVAVLVKRLNVWWRKQRRKITQRLCVSWASCTMYGILCRYDDKRAEQSRKTAAIVRHTPLKSDIYFRFIVSETSDVESITVLIRV